MRCGGIPNPTITSITIQHSKLLCLSSFLPIFLHLQPCAGNTSTTAYHLLLRNGPVALYNIQMDSSILELSCNLTTDATINTTFLAPGGLLLCSSIRAVNAVDSVFDQPQWLTMTAVTAGVFKPFNLSSGAYYDVVSLTSTLPFNVSVSFPPPVTAAPAITAQFFGVNCNSGGTILCKFAQVFLSP